MRRCFLLAAALLASATAFAQNFPTRPIRIVVPFAAGGPADITARNIYNIVRTSLDSKWNKDCVD